jgi:hypothetical protein
MTEVVMTNGRVLVLASGVWIGAFASTGAVAFAVNHLPNTSSSASVARLRLPDVTPRAPLAATGTAGEPQPVVMVLPTVEIVSHVAVLSPTKAVAAVAPAAKPAPATPKVRDISEMKCTEFRPLEQGTGGVQLCE